MTTSSKSPATLGLHAISGLHDGLYCAFQSDALPDALATSVFNAALIVEGELGLLSMAFSAHISAQRLVRLLKSESVME